MLESAIFAAFVSKLVSRGDAAAAFPVGDDGGDDSFRNPSTIWFHLAFGLDNDDWKDCSSFPAFVLLFFQGEDSDGMVSICTWRRLLLPPCLEVDLRAVPVSSSPSRWSLR